MQSAFRSVGKALLATTVVFGLGFMVFGASGMVTNQALGLLAGMTVIIALLADLLFLPPLLMVLDGTKETSEQIRGTVAAGGWIGAYGGHCAIFCKRVSGSRADRRKR